MVCPFSDAYQTWLSYGHEPTSQALGFSFTSISSAYSCTLPKPVSMARVYSISISTTISTTIRGYYRTLNLLGRILGSSIGTIIVMRFLRNAQLLKSIAEIVGDLDALAALLLWLSTYTRYPITSIDVMQIEDDGGFITIILRGCGWEEWDRLAKSVKKRLVEDGFETVARRVLIVCRDALRGSKS